MRLLYKLVAKYFNGNPELAADVIGDWFVLLVGYFQYSGQVEIARELKEAMYKGLGYGDDA